MLLTLPDDCKQDQWQLKILEVDSASCSGYYAYFDVDGMRLSGSINERSHTLAVGYPLSEADGTKGSVLCGALPSTPSA